MSKKEERSQAIELRRRGFTYRDIAQYVHVSVSTVSLWLRDEQWSHKITADNTKRASRENSKRISLLNKARGNQFKKLYSEAERSAVTEFKHYKHSPLFVGGVMLYLSSGDTRDPGLIRLADARMELHHIFIDFLDEFLGVSRENIRFWLLLYPDHDPEQCSRAWSRSLGIPVGQFHKYQVIQGGHKKRVLQYGVGNTIIGSAVLKRKLMKWIELLQKELKK